MQVLVMINDYNSVPPREEKVMSTSSGRILNFLIVGRNCPSVIVISYFQIGP